MSRRPPVLWLAWDPGRVVVAFLAGRADTQTIRYLVSAGYASEALTPFGVVWVRPLTVREGHAE
jgi:hypothetical protein